MQVKHYSNLMKITPHAQAKNISIKNKNKNINITL